MLTAVGPFGSWKTAPLGTHGDMSIAVERRPRRLKSKGRPQLDGCLPMGAAQHGDSSLGTPSEGGTMWS